jgi:predicted methyltransferase
MKNWMWGYSIGKQLIRKNKPNEIINALTLQYGQRIVDVGAGGGYFALRFSEAFEKGGRVLLLIPIRNFWNIFVIVQRKTGLRILKPFLPPKALQIYLVKV